MLTYQQLKKNLTRVNQEWNAAFIKGDMDRMHHFAMREIRIWTLMIRRELNTAKAV